MSPDYDEDGWPTPLTDAFSDGYTAGFMAAWDPAFRAGWDAGEDVTSGRIALHLANGMPSLTPPSTYADWRREVDAGPCNDPKCGACSARRGRTEFPGVSA